MRNSMGGGGFMMMPMMSPFPQEPPQQQQAPDIVVPARVRIAMEFLQSLTIKTMTRAAVSENQIDQIDGQKLTEEESNTQATACNLLGKYFAGRLEADSWEKIRVDALKKQNDGKNPRGMVLNCVMCGTSRRPRKDCPLCEGSGVILVVGAQPEITSAEDDIMGGDLPTDMMGDD